MSQLPQKIIVSPEDLQTGKPPVLRIGAEDLAPESTVAAQPFKGRISKRVLLVALAGIATVIGTWLLTTRTQEDWIEAVVARAEQSVVQLQCGESMGTGTVVATKGRRALILTNKHVLLATGEQDRSSSTPTNECEITLRSGQTAIGRLVGWARDEDVDLALLVATTADVKPFTCVTAFSNVRVGQRVIAIGHPLGLDYTVTEGIISAKRDGLWLQTTAAINHGNSGGPLVGRDGALVGINTLVYDEGVGATYGFALRVDYLVRPELWELTADIADLLMNIAITSGETK